MKGARSSGGGSSRENSHDQNDTSRASERGDATVSLSVAVGDRHEPISEGGLACAGFKVVRGGEEKIGRETKEKKGEKSVYLELRFEELREEVLRRNRELREKPLR